MDAEAQLALWFLGIALLIAAARYVARAERMSRTTPHLDRLSLVMLAAGSCAAGVSLLVSLWSAAVWAGAMALLGGAWWWGAAPLRRLIAARAPRALPVVERLTGVRR